MSGVLLKKKKVIIKKRHAEPLVWTSHWSSRRLRRFKKKIVVKETTNKSSPEKKKSSVSPHKKYKMISDNIRPYFTIKKNGSGLPATSLIGLRCKKACKLNFSTMIGIKKKAAVLKDFWQITFRKYPSLLLTRKSTGHRMGKGKGKFSSRVAIYKKNEIILEISFIDEKIFGNHFVSLLKSLPVPVSICNKSDAVVGHLKDVTKFSIATFKRA